MLVTVTRAQLEGFTAHPALAPSLSRILFALKNNGDVDRVYFVDRLLLCDLSDAMTPAELAAAFPASDLVEVEKLAP